MLTHGDSSDVGDAYEKDLIAGCFDDWWRDCIHLVFANIASPDAGTYEATEAWVYTRNDRYSGGRDIQINRPWTPTGPELVHEPPFRSEG